jgi:hypothetical protein
MGRSTRTGFVAAIVWSFAVTIVLPSPMAVRRPDRLTLAIVASDDDHSTIDVRSSMRPSDIVARAVSCDVSPLRLRLALPSIESDTTFTAGVGAIVELPHAGVMQAITARHVEAAKQLSRIFLAESSQERSQSD